jgi:type IV pilus assembly protein PilY1
MANIGRGLVMRNCPALNLILKIIFVSVLNFYCFQGALAAVNIAASPLFLTQGSTPLVMLDMSRDNQLYFKAYDDYSDINGDGVPDTTYNNSIKYYGYFDNTKCYVYSGSPNYYFVPSSDMTSDNYCNGTVTVTNSDGTTATTDYSTSNQWSGNFLNWATMTRIDEVRKILYGGYRSTDSSTATVLERSFLPNDAHSFAKYYTGSDMAKLTPFTTLTNGTSQTDGITICNTTYDSTNSKLSQNVTAPPLMRVAKGNFSLWASNERWQCRWKEEKSQSLNSTQGSNGNVSANSGINASNENPPKSTNGLTVSSLGPDYNVRVQACVSSTKFSIANESCTVYPTVNSTYPKGVFKPTGLLQTYGQNGQILFGLLTGSYNKSKSGGVLRKNIGSMANEINTTTDGTFVAASSSGGILQTLNALRIYGYRFSDGTYFDDSSTTSGSDNCKWGLNSFSNGSCSNWGNPQSEMYLESLRYLAGKTANSAFNTDDSNRFSNLKTATWSAPINNTNYCAAVSVIQFNASTSSYDSDELSGASDIGMSGSTLNTVTDSVGTGEGITGHNYFIGEISGASAPNNDQLCTAKTINNLSAALGTCPDAPRLGGSYQIAGLSYFAHTTGIAGAANYPSQKVRTYGVALAPNTPKVVIQVPGSTSGQTVTLLPACRNSDVGGNCAIVDFKIVQIPSSSNSYTGKLYVNWEDSEQGGDYDQDMWGTITYQISSSNITVKTLVVAQSTGDKMGFGYVLSGTTSDGFHVHSGINSFSYTGDGTPTSFKCLSSGTAGSCTQATQTSRTYSLGTSTAQSLQQPLFYAAKWGGFNDSNNNNKPDTASEWDSDGDGIPDTYFYATNPAQLATQLNAALVKVSGDVGAASAVATSSTHLDTNTVVFQGKFKPQDWSGQLLAYKLDSSGNASANPAWDASDAGKIPASGRKLFTWNGSAGVALIWSNLTAAQQAALTASGEADSANAQFRLNWLSGDQSKEQPNGDFRKRTTLLGDIVDSDPVYAGGDDFGYSQLPSTVPGQSTYAAYVTTKQSRTPLVLVGSNDGFLHAFNANTGAELFAYMPSQALLKAIALTRPDYGSTTNPHQNFVDGSLHVDDIYYSGQWHTVVIGSLGAGDRGVFALDISNPDSFSASNVLFEYTNADDSRLGYVLGQPTISLLADGSWSALFGNGYNSDDGKAYLFAIDMTNKSNTKVIPTGSGVNSGLAGPVLLLNANNTVTVAYAGDLLGNLWRFDLSSTTRSSWAISYGVPLFTARGPSGEVQPITSTPNLGMNIKKNNDITVFFGTGEYFAVGDNLVTGTPPVQSMYAIDDNGSAITQTDRSVLFQKTITAEDSATRTVNDSAFNWSGYRGWYLDLLSPSAGKQGERVISSPLLLYGRLLFTTFVPTQQACSFGGTGWFMDLYAMDSSTKSIIGGSGEYLPVAVVKTPGVILSGEKAYFPSNSLRGDLSEIQPGDISNNNPWSGKQSWWQLQ